MKWLITALFFVSIGFAFSAHAQAGADTVRLSSLGETISKAIKSNPTQAVYQQQIIQARYNARASKGFIYPSASGSFSGTDNLHLSVTPVPGELVGKPGTTFYAQFGKKYAYNTGITLGQDIFDWQAVFQAQIADNNLRLNQLQQDAYVQTLKEQVAKIYFSALVAKASLQIITIDQVFADNLVDLSKQRLQQGTTDALNVNLALINSNNVQQNKAQSTQLYDQSIANLKILLGEKAENELALNETIRLDSLAEAATIQLGADRGLEVYNQQINIADLQSKAQRSAAYPKLSASMYIGGQQYRNDFGFTFNDNAWNAYRYIGINLTIPLFTGFSNANKYKSALAQKNIAQIQYHNAQQQSQINDRLLIKTNHDYLDMVKASAGSFKLYGKNLDLNKQKYTEGIISMDIYLKAFQDYLTAENVYLNNLSLLLTNKATILSRQ